MRDLGMGKRLGEEMMIEELQFLIELIKSFKGELEVAAGHATLQSHCEDLWVAPEMTDTVTILFISRWTFPITIFEYGSHQHHLCYSLWEKV